jgi:hypothetical protein
MLRDLRVSVAGPFFENLKARDRRPKGLVVLGTGGSTGCNRMGYLKTEEDQASGLLLDSWSDFHESAVEGDF